MEALLNDLQRSGLANFVLHTWPLNWIWFNVVLPSWLSLVTAPFVWWGYRRIGEGHRDGWLFTITSQCGLIAIGLIDHQYGLLVVLFLMLQAFRNWWKAGRESSPLKKLAQLAGELALARSTIRRLRRQRAVAIRALRARRSVRVPSSPIARRFSDRQSQVHRARRSIHTSRVGLRLA